MKPHPKIRKTIKWGGAVVTVLLVSLWLGSGWFIALRDSKRITFAVGGGEVYCRVRYNSQIGFYPAGFVRLDRDPAWVFSPSCQSDADSFTVWMPLWIPVAMTWFATVVAWRLDTLARRRAKLNLCPKCNYDRTGLAIGAKCPECGAAPASV